MIDQKSENYKWTNIIVKKGSINIFSNSVAI